MALDTNLVNHYLLYNNADDSFGTDDGTANGGAVFQSDSVLLDGIDDYINSNQAYYANDMTISLWVKATSDSSIQYFISRRGGTDSDYEGISLGVGSDNNLYYRFDAGAGTTVNSTGAETFTDDTWTHYVIQTDLSNNKVRVYVNSSLIREADQTGDCNWIGSESGYINQWLFGRGNRDSVPDHATAYMANVRFYSDVKDQSFIDELFAEGYFALKSSATVSVTATASAYDSTASPASSATVSVSATANAYDSTALPASSATVSVTATASAYNANIPASSATVTVLAVSKAYIAVADIVKFRFVQEIEQPPTEAVFKFIQEIEQPSTSTIIERTNV